MYDIILYIATVTEIKMKKCDAYDVIKKHKQAKRKPPAAAAVYEEVDL